MLLPVIFLAALSAGTAQCSPATGNPNYMQPGALDDVIYRAGLGLVAYAPVGEPRPAAVIIHGSRGSKSTHITQLFEVLDRAGYAWFSVDYHTADDVAGALDYILCPGRFNITRDLVLIGADTGAAVALDLAMRRQVKGVVILDGSLGGISHGQTLEPQVPVLWFHGTNDDEVPVRDGEAICRKMPRRAWNAVPDAIHEFENWHPNQWTWKEDLTAWLRGDKRGLWKDITYSRPAGLPLLMNAYIPEGNGPFPAVIIVHGGGWEAGDKITYISPVLEPLARAGFAWFSIDYRLTPYVHVPEQLDDIRAAIRFVRAHAGRFHVDPNQTALLGESASGHLVSQVASAPCQGCEVQAVVSFYGIYNFTPWPQSTDEWQRSALKRLFGEWTPEILRQNSPIEFARASLPPTLLIQGDQDELMKGTKQYADRLKQVGARYE